jgi:hypothetical protein
MTDNHTVETQAPGDEPAKKWTRGQYIGGGCSHDEYYGQFVTPAIVALVERSIGRKRILNSKDPHFNDIELVMWDNLEVPLRAMATTRLALSDAVCIAKRAARQIKEGGAE